MKQKIGIIGNGCAAAECIKALRESDYNNEIHIYSDHQLSTYNPMLTTYYAAGKINFDQLFPYGSNEEFYRDYRVENHPGSPVISLDTEKKLIVNRAGFELNYDQCLIASGASPFLPPIEGIESKRVYTMRTVDDAIKLKGVLAEKPNKALVIGASMIGIKVMELLYKAGAEVCLVDLADRVFPLIAHQGCSQVIENRLIKMGIKLKFGAGISRIEDTDRGIKAYFGDNSSEEANLLLMCIGVRPNIGFVDRSQVEVQQGILVDETMQTNVPGLYAAGDVAQGQNLITGNQQIIGLWASARYQGRMVGRNMAGEHTTYSGNIPQNITHFMGMVFIGIGDPFEYDRLETKQDDRKFIQLFWREGNLTGANFIDYQAEAGVVKNAVIKGLVRGSTIPSQNSMVLQNYLLKSILAEVGAS